MKNTWGPLHKGADKTTFSDDFCGAESADSCDLVYTAYDSGLRNHGGYSKSRPEEEEDVVRSLARTPQKFCRLGTSFCNSRFYVWEV